MSRGLRIIVMIGLLIVYLITPGRDMSVGTFLVVGGALVAMIIVWVSTPEEKDNGKG